MLNSSHKEDSSRHIKYISLINAELEVTWVLIFLIFKFLNEKQFFHACILIILPSSSFSRSSPLPKSNSTLFLSL